MAVTDLLDRIPFSPRERRRPSAPKAWSFDVEVPQVERVGIDLPAAADLPADAGPEAPPMHVVPVRSRPPLPSYAVVLIGGLSLLSLALAAALAVATGDPPEGPTLPGPEAAAAAGESPDRDERTATFTADPAPIPIDLLTRLEKASEEPLEGELSRLLDAIQHGFGRRSVQLEPTLRSYVYRMSSRFEWNPDSFRVAVTASDADLAVARGATL